MIAVVLASGFGTRMGQNKLMMKIKDRPMVEHVIRKASSVLKTLVISQYDEVLDIAVKYDCHVIKNHHPQRGLSESLKLAFTFKNDSYLILLGDEPEISTELLKSYEHVDDQFIHQTEYQNGIGHPILLPSWLKCDVIMLEGDIGARKIISRYPLKRRLLSTATNKPKDIDTLEEFENLLNDWKSFE